MTELIPHPSSLIESMRNMGYRPHTALADLVDNSISAGARNVKIEFIPSSSARAGWVRVLDDGEGMSREELFNAMRWGGEGPGAVRERKDLGRFGLGLKTASFSMGRRLTLVSKKNGQINVLRWDLEGIRAAGKWTPVDSVHPDDASYLSDTFYDASDDIPSGTAVLITDLDKLRVDARSPAAEENNRSNLITTAIGHLRLVFHRFLERKSLNLKFGSAQLNAWNLFGLSGVSDEPSWQKYSESLSDGKVFIRTFILPHHKDLTPDQHKMLAGPSGWNAHQGFFAYRADRLIVAGGWFGFSKPEEHCKLARIAIDLPNELDGPWGLDVIKSKITPPAILMGDIERIARAARSQAMQRYGFHGEREAPEKSESLGDAGVKAFWMQIPGRSSVLFRINRGHPLIESLVQNLNDSRKAEAFIHAFERLLPVAAIMQQPAKTTHGLIAEPEEKELNDLLYAVRMVIDWFKQTGKSEEEAKQIALASQPFVKFHEILQKHLTE
jgi:hypothetical protein